MDKDQAGVADALGMVSEPTLEQFVYYNGWSKGTIKNGSALAVVPSRWT